MSFKIRNIARDKPCQLRIENVCSNVSQQTVLAHIRLAGLGGIGLKPPDLCGLHACHPCHDVMDGRVDIGLTREEIEWYILRGLLRTLAVVSKELDLG